MAKHPSFLGSVQGFIKESIDTPDADAYVTQHAFGGSLANGDFWGLAFSGLNTPGLTTTLVKQTRTIAGVVYTQDPNAGVWEVDDEPDPDPVDDAFIGQLEMADITVERNAFGYVLSGTFPADPKIEELVVEVEEGTNRLRSVAFRSRVERSLFDGLIEPEGGDLIQTLRVEVTAYDLDLAMLAVPPVGIPTVIAPGLGSAFLVALPADWVQLSATDLNAMGVTDGYAAPDQAISLLVVAEDLSGTGLTALEDYVEFLETEVMIELATVASRSMTTLQGDPVWVIAGTAIEDGSKFRRLVYVSPGGVAVNLSFVQGTDPATGNLSSAWDDNQDLVDFMINSFLVFLDN